MIGFCPLSLFLLLGETALHKLSTPEVAELLLNSNADLNLPNRFGDSAWSSLIMSSERSSNHLDLVKLFLKKGAEPNKSFENDPKKRYPIHFTTTTEYMDLLMNHGADINSVDRIGQTILFTIVDLVPPNMISLLKHAVDVHHADVNAEKLSDKSTILTNWIWSKFWHTETGAVVDFLIERGADVNHISSVTIFYR